ncbi:MAG: helix-turn-helix domain-containing protein [Rhodospirillaceae bacterium]|nr:helix-turn-helix domain-containing protein [Rhodospirillaceae bacterium]
MSTALQDHRTTPGSIQALSDAIEAHTARKTLSRCAFGAAAHGDASFPDRPGRGSDVRLGTADKVLARMNPETIGLRFLRRVEAFLKVTGIEPHVLGREALGDPGLVLRLGKGRSPTPGTVDKASPARLEAARAAIEDGTPAVPVYAAAYEEREMSNNTGFMKTEQIAKHLGLSPRTLESYRSRGGGPAFYVFGSVVRYLLSDVLKWASKRRRRSTSDDGLQSPTPEDGDEEQWDEEDVDDDRPGKSRR